MTSVGASVLHTSAAIVSQPVHALTMILSVCNAQPSITSRQLGMVLFNKTLPPRHNVQDMFRTCTNRKVDFTSRIIDNPIYIPCTDPSGVSLRCDVDAWASYADNYAAKVLGIRPGTYSHHIYLLPKNDPCGFGGLGSVGTECLIDRTCRVWVSGSIPKEIAVYMHELGHNLGLPHASYMSDQYGDLTDVMGYCCKVRCFAAPNTDRMKWTRAAYQFTLPYNKPSIELNLKPKQYVMIYDKVRREKTYIQFRVAGIGYDKDIAVTGVNIYILPQLGSAMSQLQDTLILKNQMWQNIYAGIKVTLLDISQTRVRVLLGQSASMSITMANNYVPV